MSLIVDASVAVKWFAEEEHSDRADALLEGHERLIAPDLVLAEVSNVMWKKLRRKTLQRDQAVAAIERLPRYFEELIPIGELAGRATALAILLDHPVYDCFYVALAERERHPLVSADGKLLTLLGSHKIVDARPL